MPPTLGQHTRELLAETGVDADTIERMVEAGTALVS
jgi:crotonobetainyl-CoA:carnitine CoA-transferase CaiB-like acyl-CoA transferase